MSPRTTSGETTFRRPRLPYCPLDDEGKRRGAATGVALRLERSPRPEWSPLPHEGCVGVDGKVLVSEPTFFFSLLRFAPNATIHEHPGPNDTYVSCLEGEGWTSVGEERAQLRAGEFVFWPKGVPHRLWTEGTTMTTLMFERTA